MTKAVFGIWTCYRCAALAVLIKRPQSEFKSALLMIIVLMTLMSKFIS